MEVKDSVNYYTLCSIVLIWMTWYSFAASSATFFTLPREIRDTIYASLWSDEDTVRDMRMGMKSAPDCFPCYHAGYRPQRLPWFCQSFGLGPMWGKMLKRAGGRVHEMFQEIALSFYENFTRFEVECPRDLPEFFDHDFFHGS